MTAQASEKIIIDYEEYNLLCEPLASYLEEKKLEFDWSHTACWRGYAGTWELKDKQLYLIGFAGKIKGEAVDLKFLFPDAIKDDSNIAFPSYSVKADWFTGHLRIAIGDMIQYVHAGYSSLYSDEMIIEVEQGNVVKTSFKHNEYDERLEDMPF